MEEIRNALNAGLEVITHTDAVSVPGWSGAGYIIYDADTGGGAFKIAGGGNGGVLGLSTGFGIGALIMALLAGGISTILLQVLLIVVLIAIIEVLILSLVVDSMILDCFTLGGLIGIDVALIIGPLGLKELFKQIVAAIIALADTFGFIYVPTPSGKDCF